MGAGFSLVPTLRAFAGRWKRRMFGGPETRRAAYKRVWNAQAGSEAGAMVAVAGHADEAELKRTADATVRTLEETVGIRPSDSILEIGAGVGRVGRVLAPRCRQWIGADVSEAMLRHLRRRLADLPNVRAVPVSGYDLAPFENGSLDIVYCTVVFMHLDEWERYRYIREAMRVLKPGGRLYVDNFNLASDEGWALFEEHLAMDPLSRPAHISKSSTSEELVTYLRRAGFADVKHTTFGLWVAAWGRKPG